MRVGDGWRVLRRLVVTARPHQWYKQGVLLFGIFFSRSVTSLSAWESLLPAVVSFTVLASATYVYNDVRDREADRRHPVKQNRPIASGRVGVRVAVVFGGLLIAAGLWLATTVGPLFTLVVVSYLAQNALYSLFVKRVAVLDVIVVAVGFVLRAVAGVVAIDVSLSPWLVVCTFLAALVLAIGKRRHEIRESDDPSETRVVLETYDEQTLEQLLSITVATLLVSYSLYTVFGTSQWMLLTLPFAFFATFRYYLLVNTVGHSPDPADLFTDRPFLVNGVIWLIVVVSVLYLPVGSLSEVFGV